MDAQTGVGSVPTESVIRTQSNVRLSKGHSAVTNGKRLHVVRPGDTAWARRFRDVLAEIVSDLGGPDSGLSEGQRQLARRAATISIMCEKLEGEAASGHDIDADLFGMLTDRLGRTFGRLGLRREARTLSRTLSVKVRNSGRSTWASIEQIRLRRHRSPLMIKLLPVAKMVQAL